MNRFLKKIEIFIRKIKIWILLNKKYKTTKPNFVLFPDYDTKVFINPADWRAIKKIAFDFARGRIGRNVKYWRDFINYNKPDICLDIGVNYGECIFSMSYPQECKIIGIEANPMLTPYIQKSRDAHTDAEKMEIINCLVGNEDKKDCVFYVNLNWSGGSSAIKTLNQSHEKKEFKVDQQKVDTILSKHESSKSLVFKMDVEGFEPFVLQGMQASLDKIGKVVGYIEIDKNFLSEIKFTLDDVQKLFSGYDIYWPTEKKGTSLRKYSDLSKIFQSQNIEHTDIIIVKSQNNWLPSQWKIVE